MAALLRPSSAPMWGVCSGSVMASMGAPDIDTEQKREGTAAHWAGELALQSGGMCADYEGRLHANGVRIDAEMCEAAQVYVDDVRRVLAEFGGELQTEVKLEMPSIHPENRGYVDGMVAVYAVGRLFLWEFKYGRRRVDAKDNLQMVDYAAGIKDMYGIDGHAEQHTRIDLIVVQPRCFKPNGPVDTWSVLLSDLRPYWNQLRAKAEEATTNPKFTAGKQCRDCPAIIRCDTAAMYNYSVYQYGDQPYEINTLDDKQIATEYRNMSDAFEVVKARRDALHDEIKHRINAGRETGMRLSSKPGRSAWTVDKAAVIATFKAIGVDASKSDIKTPTQVEKLVPAEHAETAALMLKQLSQRNYSSELIEADQSIASRVFSKN